MGLRYRAVCAAAVLVGAVGVAGSALVFVPASISFIEQQQLLSAKVLPRGVMLSFPDLVQLQLAQVSLGLATGKTRDMRHGVGWDIKPDALARLQTRDARDVVSATMACDRSAGRTFTLLAQTTRPGYDAERARPRIPATGLLPEVLLDSSTFINVAGDSVYSTSHQSVDWWHFPRVIAVNSSASSTPVLSAFPGFSEPCSVAAPAPGSMQEMLALVDNTGAVKKMAHAGAAAQQLVVAKGDLMAEARSIVTPKGLRVVVDTGAIDGGDKVRALFNDLGREAQRLHLPVRERKIYRIGKNVEVSRVVYATDSGTFGMTLHQNGKIEWHVTLEFVSQKTEGASPARG